MLSGLDATSLDDGRVGYFAPSRAVCRKPAQAFDTSGTALVLPNDATFSTQAAFASARHAEGMATVRR